MSRLGFVARRVAGLLVTVWIVFTLAFAYVRLTPFVGDALTGDDAPASVSDPLLTQYLDWMVWLLTLWEDPLMDTILTSLSYTAAYLVPAIVFAVAAGVGLRLYTVAREDDTLDTWVTVFAVIAVSIPVFILAIWLRDTFLTNFFDLIDTVRIYNRGKGALDPRNIAAAGWGIAAMTPFLFAVQLRYSGEILRDYKTAEFVKTARVKGAGPLSVGRHIFRNTAIPLLTLFFTDMLGMVAIGVFVVEYILGVPGVGELLVQAVVANDVRLYLALSVLVVLVGVCTNFVQDLAYMLYDPRVDFGD